MATVFSFCAYKTHDKVDALDIRITLRDMDTLTCGLVPSGVDVFELMGSCQFADDSSAKIQVSKDKLLRHAIIAQAYFAHTWHLWEYDYSWRVNDVSRLPLGIQKYFKGRITRGGCSFTLFGTRGSIDISHGAIYFREFNIIGNPIIYHDLREMTNADTNITVMRKKSKPCHWARDLSLLVEFINKNQMFDIELTSKSV